MKTSNEDVLGDILLGFGLEGRDPRRADRDLSRAPAPGRTRSDAISRENMEAEVTELFRTNAPSLSRYAATLAREPAVVQDGLQEAFLRYFVARTGGQRINNPRAWLFRVLRNYLLDCNRKTLLAWKADLEDAALVVDAGQDLEAQYERSEVFSLALSMLSPREREILSLIARGCSNTSGITITASVTARPISQVAFLFSLGGMRIGHSLANGQRKSARGLRRASRLLYQGGGTIPW